MKNIFKFAWINGNTVKGLMSGAAIEQDSQFSLESFKIRNFALKIPINNKMKT